MLCLAIGAVVVGVPTTCQTPLSGHRSPVFAVVPMGAFVCVILFLFDALSGNCGCSRPQFADSIGYNHLLRHDDFPGHFFRKQESWSITVQRLIAWNGECLIPSIKSLLQPIGRR